MKSIQKKIIIIMLSTTFAIFFATITVINFYQKIYLENKAKHELLLEKYYYLDYKKFQQLEDDENSIFEIERLWLQETGSNEEEINEEKQWNRAKERALKDLYYSGKIKLNEIAKISNQYGDFYLLAIRANERQIYRPIADEINADEKVIIDTLLVIDISNATNMTKMFNLIFAIVLFIAIMIEGAIALYLGRRIDKEQQQLKHFFQNASHELKTPLMSIQGYVQGMETGVISDPKIVSQVVVRQSKKMQQLIDEILNISKLESKEYILQKEVIDIRDIIDESLQNFRQISKKNNIKVVTDFDEKQTEIIGDTLQIYKAINTIIDNAFKFAQSQVTVTTYPSETFLCIEIYNDGQRINEENLEHIFARFYSANDFSSGIGLAMAKEIALLSKGDLSVKNKIDGVAFTVRLPKKFN